MKGLNEIKANLAKVEARVAAATERGQQKAADHLLAASQPLVPVGETGELKASGYATTKGRGLNAVATVGYSADYALKVHEDLEARHDDGQAKFLEQPAREEAPRMLAIVAAELAAALKGGGP